MENDLISSSRKEKVYIETQEYVMRGYIYMPITSKKERILTDALNSDKKFIALKDCELECKRLGSRKEIEKVEFLEVNVNSILIMKPILEK